MTRVAPLFTTLPVASFALFALLACSLACDSLPGKPNEADRFVAPEAVTDFATLYAENCSGCHGAEGRLGSARPLADPIYLAIAPDAALHAAIGAGIDGTPMPAFAIAEGGMLSDAQVTALVEGMRAAWGGTWSGASSAKLPAYRAASRGNPTRGAASFGVFCAECHGSNGRGADKGGSVVDSSYLELTSDQGLRTVVIAGREDLGMPDYAGYVEGRAMNDREISDVVAWLIAQRARYPGQLYPADASGLLREGRR